MLVVARGCLLGLELAEVGTNSVVRRKTLFESAERADWLRIFFHLNGPGCGAQILRRRCFTYSEDVTSHARGRAGTALYYLGQHLGTKP